MTRIRILVFLLFGTLIGSGIGLYVGWIAWPTEFTDANPSVLQETYRNDYVQMIADTYALDGDLTAAQTYLNEVSSDPNAILLETITDKVLADANETDIRRLVQLASDLDISSPVMAPFLSQGATP